MVLLIIIPFLNGYFIGNIPNIFRQTHMMMTGHSFPPLSLVRSRLARHNLGLEHHDVFDLRKRTTHHKKHQETNSAHTGVSEIQTISNFQISQIASTFNLFGKWNVDAVLAALAMEWPLEPLDRARDVRKPPSANSRSVSSAGIKMNFNMLQYASIWVCLKMLCTPKPNGFADHYPVFKWLFHWEYCIPNIFRQTHMLQSWKPTRGCRVQNRKLRNLHLNHLHLRTLGSTLILSSCNKIQGSGYLEDRPTFETGPFGSNLSPLVICYVAIENGPFIVDLPIHNGGSFHSFLLVITRG